MQERELKEKELLKALILEQEKQEVGTTQQE